MKRWKTKLQAVLLVAVMIVEIMFGDGTITAIAADVDQSVKVQIQISYGQTEARGMLDAMNEFRQGNDAWVWNANDTGKITYSNLGKLKLDPILEQTAMLRAAEIALSYSHTRPNGQTCFTAYSDDMAGGYRAENIAAGYLSAEDVFKGWQETEEPYSGQGHRRNMLGSHYISVGIAHVTYQGIHYWVQEFSSQSSGQSLARANNTTMVKELEVLKTNIQSLALSKLEYALTTGQSVSLEDLKILAKVQNFWSYRSDTCMLENTYTASTNNESVALIKNGMLTAGSAGSTKLTVRVLDQEIQIPVTVTEATVAPPEKPEPSADRKPEITKTPTVSQQPDTPESNETGFTAMIGFQTSDFDCRETYEDKYYSTGNRYLSWLMEQDPTVDLSNVQTCNGRNIYYNGYLPQIHSKTLSLRNPEKVELNKDAVAIDVNMTGDGEYSIAINNLNLNTNPDGTVEEAGEIFNMLYVATDIPVTGASGIEVKARSVKIDGEEMLQGDVILPQKLDNKKYGQFMLAYAYHPEEYADGVAFGKDDVALSKIPEKSIEITFSISGVNWMSPKYQPKEIDTALPMETKDPNATTLPTNPPINRTKISQPFDIGVVANANEALTMEVVDPQAENGKICASVFGSTEYWNLLKTSTVNNITEKTVYAEHQQTFYETEDGSLHITETGEYKLTVTAVGDSEDLTGDGAIWLALVPNEIPLNYQLAGYSITVRNQCYAWGGRLYEDRQGNVYLSVCNQWETDNDLKLIANPIKNAISVKKGDKITFTFTVIEKDSVLPDPSKEPEKPGQSPEVPTQEPEKPSQSPKVPTQDPEETALPDPIEKPNQGNNDNDLTDDLPNRDLTVKGLDIATGNVVKKGFLSIPQVQLTWDTNRNCDGYEIWRKEGNQSFVKVDYIDDCDETEWFDTDLKKGCKYTYQVRGCREEDDGTISWARESKSVSVKIRQTVKSCTYTAKRTGKKLKITFKKAEGTKYQIQVKYGKSQKWKKATGSLKKKIVKKVSPKKLKVRVRTCEKVNGKMKYSRWSKVKTVW